MADATRPDRTVETVSPAGAGYSGRPPRVGGMALKNGLILMSERYWAAAIREGGGEIVTASGRRPRVPVGGGGVSSSGGVPVIRGLGRFVEGLLVLAQVKAMLPGAQSPLEGGRVMGALAASVGATEAVKIFVPKSAFVQEAGTALATFVPAVLAVRKSAVSGYHGAEHKVIGGMEAGIRSGGGHSRIDPTGSKAAAKEHDRCGSNLIGPYLLATVATNLLVRGRSGRKSPAASAVAGAVSLGVALEALRWSTNHGDSLLARVLLMPGRAVQRCLTTSEPTDDQLEVGERALAELLRLENAAG